jgi:hypothetical protein
MVSKKAISLLDLLLQGDIKLRDGMLDPSKSWNSDHDAFHSLVQTWIGFLDDNIKILEAIQKELHVNCKHPKKMRDKTSDGQEYCMNCNNDL